MSQYSNINIDTVCRINFTLLLFRNMKIILLHFYFPVNLLITIVKLLKTNLFYFFVFLSKIFKQKFFWFWKDVKTEIKNAFRKKLKNKYESINCKLIKCRKCKTLFLHVKIRFLGRSMTQLCWLIKHEQLLPQPVSSIELPHWESLRLPTHHQWAQLDHLYSNKTLK